MNVDKILSDYNVLLTGASGFVGMVILQRLLNVKNAENAQIFCTLRLSSKYASVEERLRNEILKNEIMQLKENEIHQIIHDERVIALQSELTHDFLGFTDDIMTQLKNCASKKSKKGIVIIHCAADVIFNREFNESININVNGTYQCIQVARKINAKAFIYVSTLYVNSRENTNAVIKEKIYDENINMNQIFEKWLKLKQNNTGFTPDEIVYIKSIGNGKWPNNYTFTKNMSENVVRHYCNAYNLASSIVRFGIVSPIHKGNNRGWFIGKGGFVFFVIGLATGKLTYLPGNGKGRPNFVPVDYCADSIIVISSKTISKLSKTNQIYQCSVINHDLQWTVQDCMDYIWPRFYNHSDKALKLYIANKQKPKYSWIQNETLFYLICLVIYDIPLGLLIAVSFVLTIFTKVFWIKLFYYLIGEKYDLNLMRNTSNVITLNNRQQAISLKMILLTYYNKSYIQALFNTIKFMTFARRKLVWFNNNYSKFVNARWCFTNKNVTDLFYSLDKESKEKYDLNPENINLNLCAFEAAEINFLKYLNYKQNQKAKKNEKENDVKKQLSILLKKSKGKLN